MSVKAQTRRTRHVVDTTMTKRKHVGSYSLSTGEYQELHDKLCKELEKKVDAFAPFDWLAKENWYFTCFNGTNGMYIEKHTRGCGAKTAFENNRVHGFRKLSDLRMFAQKLGAVHVVAYCDDSSDDEKLERAVTEATLLLNKHLYSKR